MRFEVPAMEENLASEPQVVQLDRTNQRQVKMMASEDKKIKTNSAPENEAPPEKTRF